MKPFKKDSIHYAQKIRQGVYTVSELVERAIDNIQTLNDTYSAVVSTQFDEARLQALIYDQFLLTVEDPEDLPAYYGVPILLKDLGQMQEKQPMTNGMQVRKDSKGSVTDHFVQQILDLGFIVIGRTNVPELGLRDSTSSYLFGECLSGEDPSMNSGGSSGGAATALRTGMVPLVTGSDGGGSIRIPAATQGLWGLKPSRGSIVEGPRTYRSWQQAVSHFFLTQSARETQQLLTLFAPHLPTCQDQEFRVGYLSTHAEELASVIARFKDGSTVSFQAVDLEEVLYPKGLALKFHEMVSVETAATLETIHSSIPLSLENLEPATYKYWQLGKEVPAYRYSQSMNVWDQWTQRLEDSFQSLGIDAVITPSLVEKRPAGEPLPTWEDVEEMSLEAFAFYQSEYSFKNSNHFYLLNMTGHPALVIPFGEESVQLIAPRNQDHRLVALAAQLEGADQEGDQHVPTQN